MPHKVFNLGSLTATTEAVANTLVPGIAPGASRAGEDMKPALLLRDAYIEVVDWVQDGTVDFHSMKYYLKLSQENDMTPGLLLPVGMVHNIMTDAPAGSAQAQVGLTIGVEQLFNAQGTIWVPRFVGVRTVETGVMSIDVDVHLDYEVIDIPFMDWFLGWDWLDNIVDNQRDY